VAAIVKAPGFGDRRKVLEGYCRINRLVPLFQRKNLVAFKLESADLIMLEPGRKKNI